MTPARALVSVADYRRAAQRVLPKMLYDFVAGGAASQATLRRNTDGFDDWWLRGRAFRAATETSLRTHLLGVDLALPILTAPTGASGLLWPEGEVETGRATADAGTIMEVSAGSILSMEDIAAGSNGPKWLQLFLYKDRGLTKEFLQRARAAGYGAICVTTDCPVHGIREQDIRNGFAIDRRLTWGTLLDAAMHIGWWRRMAGTPRASLKNFAGRSTGGMADMAAYIASVLDPDIGWDDLSWLRAQWDGPLIVKGILHPDDAHMAIERGADCLQVSNHGGRQLDASLATIDALPSVVAAARGRVPVLLDGGVSRGSHVLKAIALGATACLIGRSHLWGLAVAGRAGVRHILSILDAEMRNAMTIGGWRSLDELDHAAITRLPVDLPCRELVP